MKDSYDVVIVGAGPAGLTTAEVLASRGKDVVVLEKNKEISYKISAGGITKNVLKMGVPENILQRTFQRIVLSTPKKRKVLEDDDIFLATVNMKDFHEWLAKRAKDAGAEIITDCKVTSFEKNIVKTSKGDIKFNYLVGADGSASIIRKCLNIETKKMLVAFQYIIDERFEDIEIYIDAERLGSTYAWIFPYSNTTSIGSGGDPENINNIKIGFEKWCNERNINYKKGRFEVWPINYDYRGYKFGNVFLAGDAAGFASGLTGEGIYFAMISGIDIANSIIDPNYKCKRIEHILKIKKIEEGLLNFASKKNFTNLSFKILLSLLSIKPLKKYILENPD